MGFCIKGRVVVAPNQAEPRAVYSVNEPQIVYRASSADVAFWGFDYTTFDNGASFAPGYQIFQSDEAGCQSDPDRYDCINATCAKSDQYNTPGVFASLEECQQNCGAGCSGKCISSAEWAKIEGLAGQLRAKNCG